MKNNMTTTVIAVVVVGALAFFGGMKYQQSKSSNSQLGGAGATNGVRGSAQFGQRGGQGRGGATAGEILSSDDKSFTVKMSDGSSKIVLLTDKTQINKAASATKSDLKTGTRVAVFGTPNSDGSITAQNIQINPQTRMDQGRQNGQPNPTQ